MMEATTHVSVPLRAGKKMKKRRELDALVAHAASTRGRGGGGGHGVHKRPAGGASSHDQLLSESTDDRDDYWSGGGKGGGGGVGGCGSARGGQAARLLLRRRACASLLRACTAALVFACVVATVTVMWLFIDIREQVTSLRSKLDQVVAGSQDVPEALQKCHSLSRELQQNQTTLSKSLDGVTTQLNNFSSQLSAMQYELHEVQDKVKAAPELVNVPKNLEELRGNVALFGSQIRDLDATVADLKNQNYQLQETSRNLVQNLTSLKQTVTVLLNTTQQSQGTEKESTEEKQAVLALTNLLSQNITNVNSTLSSKLQWLADDQKSDHKDVQNLLELGQNVSARVTTLEGVCAKMSLKNSVLQRVENLTEQIGSNEAQLHSVSLHVTQLQYNYTQLMSLMNEMQDKLYELKSLVSPSPMETTTG